MTEILFYLRFTQCANFFGNRVVYDSHIEIRILIISPLNLTLLQAVNEKRALINSGLEFFLTQQGFGVFESGFDI